MYHNAKELLELTRLGDRTISDVVLENECRFTEKNQSEVFADLRNTIAIMKNSSSIGLDKNIVSMGGLIGGDAKRLEEYRLRRTTICGDAINIAMARALSCSQCNASMGLIVAAPTAGSCGIVPAAVITAAERLETDEIKRENLFIHALLTASGVGQIIAKNATVSGAEGGCQAECGSASAMAAAALTEMHGGTPEMAFHAASICIMNVMGLVCDPVGGLVELPCLYRNSMGVVNAMTSADLALAGVASPIPFDEVVEAMYRVGKAMPESLKETAMGGIATTPTALELGRN